MKKKLSLLLCLLLGSLSVPKIAQATSAYDSALALIEPGETEVILSTLNSSSVKVLQQKCSATGCGQWREALGKVPVLKYKKFEVWKQEGTGIEVHQSNTDELSIPFSFSSSSVALELTGISGNNLALQIRSPQTNIGLNPKFEATLTREMTSFSAVFPNIKQSLEVTEPTKKCEAEGFTNICMSGYRLELMGLFIEASNLKPGQVIQFDSEKNLITMEFMSDAKPSPEGNYTISYKLIIKNDPSIQ